MSSKEPDARIRIDKMLLEAGWKLPGWAKDEEINVTTEIPNYFKKEFDYFNISINDYNSESFSKEMFNNVLDYINDFRLKYFGIKEPYDLMSPSDTFLEDEIFKTVSDDDDGF